MPLTETDALAAISSLQKKLRIAVSFHAYFLYCLVRAANEFRGVNTYRHGKKLIEFDDIDILTPIDKRLPHGVRIPVGHIVRAAQSKTLAQINWELRHAVRAVDLGHDAAVAQRRRIARLPKFVRRLISRRIQNDPFLLKKLHGTIALTSVNRKNFPGPYYPITPTAHTLTMAIGSLVERPRITRDGRVEIRKTLCVSGAADHEIVDGMLLTEFVNRLETMLASAEGLDDQFVQETLTLLGRNQMAHASHT